MLILTKKRNRNLLLGLLLFILWNAIPKFSHSQTYGNEWINYSQNYYAIPIVNQGVYKITYNDLNGLGVPLTTIQPNQFQIFAKERELPIEVTGSGDNSFDPGDEIWFYATGNDGWLDSLLFENPNDIANYRYSFYNDTLHYYLTWTNTGTGRRFTQETDVNFSAYTPQSFFYKKADKQHNNAYNQGPKLSGLSYCKFMPGEGWFSGSANGVTGGYDFNISIYTPQVYASGPGAELYAVSASNSNAAFTGQGNHHFQIITGNSSLILVDSIYTSYQLIKNKVLYPIGEMANSGNNTTLKHRIVDDQGANSDQQAVGLFELKYPHNPHFENSNFLKFEFPTNFNGPKSRFVVSGYSAGSWNLWSIDNQPINVPIIENSGTLEMLIPDGSGLSDRKMIAFNDAAVQNIPSIFPINGNGMFTNYSSFLVDNPYIILTHQSLLSSAQDYANYRSSIAGGSYNSQIITVNELYHQFGGGIKKHVLGLRRFLYASVNLWNKDPEYVFIIGKSVREANETSATEPGSRKSTASYQENLVPSFGYPSSDHLIVAGLQAGTGLKPGIPIGRLSAQNPNHVQGYLNKIITFEQNQDPNSIYTIADKAWQKHILHFGGGSNPNEQQNFKGFLNTYKGIIEDTLFGGSVDSYFKTTSQPINPVVSGQVNDRIAEGVSIMTFFGHASADGFDQNVDDPMDWNNNGKYPLVLGNACYTGDIHQPSSASTSEEWVLIEDLGAIGFLSTVKLGFGFSLNLFTTELYKNISHKMYGSSIGKIVQETIDLYQNYGTNQAYTSASMGMTLHGDPAIRINPHDKPEFVLDQSRVFVTPDEIDLNVDTLNLNVVVTNIGRATNDLIKVEVTRSFPNNNGDSVYVQYMNGSRYLDTVVFRLPVYANLGIGINNFNIKVDLPSNTPEQYDEVFNNELDYTYIIDIDGILPAWPYEFAVVPYDTVTVKASTINPLAKEKSYRFEIDTTDLFNSPFRKFQIITQQGGTVEVAWDNWINAASGNNEQMILNDSTVVFWRVSKDTTSPTWFESSFQYIKGKWGWGQDHFFQRKRNLFNGQIYDRVTRKTEFGDNFAKISCDVFGNGSNLYEWNGTLYRLNGQIADYSLCGLTPSIHVAVIDNLSLEPWGTYGYEDGTSNLINANHQFGNANNFTSCRSRVEKYFIFRQNDATQLQALEDMLNNEVPDSAYILIYSTLYAEFNNWSSLQPSLYTTLNNLGSDSLVPGHSNVPFIMLTKKGNPGFTKEVLGATINDFITMTDTIYGVDYIGKETSTIIGPAKNWDKLYWKSSTNDITPGDSIRIKLTGIEINNSQTLVLDTVLTFDDSLENLNNWLPPSTYTRLKLSLYHHDSIHFTPRQLDRWHVLYDPVPEAAYIDAATLYKTFSDSIQEGEEVAMAIDIGNISQFDMDSIKVNYWIEDANRIRHDLPYPRQDSLRIGQILRDTIHFDSRFFPGLNSLWIEVNPYINSTETDQPEQYHFNNIAQIPFYVSVDDVNPILDVTFDGEHILNGDIVSPSPEIFISLKDENPYLLMDDILDTANFDIDLILPNGDVRNIHFAGAYDYSIHFEPAEANDKKFKIYFEPENLKDGLHKLRVQGRDKTGNKSGDFYYEIEFEVINKSTITRLMNYPNPFSTRTQFVFTLTGSKTPDYMKIQIMTVTGKVVREITVDELGPIKIGRNITSYAWDGRDEFGDQLANGVYLYRVIAEIDGEPIELRTSGADEYFKKDFGKMVLFR